MVFTVSASASGRGPASCLPSQAAYSSSADDAVFGFEGRSRRLPSTGGRSVAALRLPLPTFLLQRKLLRLEVDSQGVQPGHTIIQCLLHAGLLGFPGGLLFFQVPTLDLQLGREGLELRLPGLPLLAIQPVASRTGPTAHPVQIAGLEDPPASRCKRPVSRPGNGGGPRSGPTAGRSFAAGPQVLARQVRLRGTRSLPRSRTTLKAFGP